MVDGIIWRRPSFVMFWTRGDGPTWSTTWVAPTLSTEHRVIESVLCLSQRDFLSFDSSFGILRDTTGQKVIKSVPLKRCRCVEEQSVAFTNAILKCRRIGCVLRVNAYVFLVR